jgi:hypothetical protein
MPITKKSHASYPYYLGIGANKFQVVRSFTYLGSDVNCNNNIRAEIQKHILATNRCFHRLRKCLRSHLTSKNKQILMYNVLIRPVLTYASQILTLSKTNEGRLSLFERKVLWCIFGAKQENGTWQKWYNYELYETFNEPNIVTYIQVKRLAWAGHLVCMNNDRTLKDRSNKCWKAETVMGGWCWSRYKNIRGQELEESHPQQKRMGFLRWPGPTRDCRANDDDDYSFFYIWFFTLFKNRLYFSYF